MLKMSDSILKKRLCYCVSFFVLFLTEVFIAIFVHDAFIRPYVGDILVVGVLYCAIRVVLPTRCKLLSLWVFLFAAGVEVLQYFHLVRLLGLEEHTVLRIILGSTFDGMDLLCYAAGCVLLGFYDWFSIKKTATGK